MFHVSFITSQGVSIHDSQRNNKVVGDMKRYFVEFASKITNLIFSKFPFIAEYAADVQLPTFSTDMVKRDDCRLD